MTLYTGTRGFSIGIDDVTPGLKLQRDKKTTIEAGYAQCDERIKAFHAGTLDLQPGCNAEQTLEAEVLGLLSQVGD